MITQKELKEILEYNPESGLFTWLTGKTKGKIAGSKNKKGYICIKAGSKISKAHRLAFLYTNGELPENEVDHINQIKDDNKWDNLREVSTGENAKNRSVCTNNKTGVMGVTWHNKNSRWVANITVDGKRIYLGSFVQFSDAVNARKNAEVLYGFHENHGKDKVC